MALCKLIQSCLSRWMRLIPVGCPQKLWGEGGTLGDTTVAQLDDMRHWEEADHVHQELKSKSCGQPETNTGSDTVSPCCSLLSQSVV